MKFCELNPSSLKSVRQRFLEVFSRKIKEELGVNEIRCPVCSKSNAKVWVNILDVESYAGIGIPYQMIGKIEHCTCMNCGVFFFPMTVKPKKNPPGSYTSYPHLYHFCVDVSYSVDCGKLQRLLCG